jgi:hypothetical protein
MFARDRNDFDVAL